MYGSEGLLGAFYVTIIILAFPKLGPGLTIWADRSWPDDHVGTAGTQQHPRGSAKPHQCHEDSGYCFGDSGGLLLFGSIENKRVLHHEVYSSFKLFTGFIRAKVYTFTPITVVAIANSVAIAMMNVIAFTPW